MNYDAILQDADHKKYAAWYIRLIEACRYPHGDIYTEKHHILPQCLYPEHATEKSNIIRLSAREHFIAHLLLYKAFPTSRKLTFAFFAMTSQKSANQQRDYTINSTIYRTVKEKVRPLQVENGSLALAGKVISKNTISGLIEVVSKPDFDLHDHLIGHARGVTRTFTEEHKAAMRKPHRSVPKTEAHKAAISASHKGKTHTPETCEKLSSACHFTKKWIITFPDGHEETITNLNKFCNDHGFSQGNMCKTLDGKRTHKGFRVRRPEEMPEIISWFNSCNPPDHQRLQYYDLQTATTLGRNGIDVASRDKEGQTFVAFEHEWRDRQKQVKAYLLGAMGKYERRINARDCQIKINPDKTMVREFLDDWHIQGATFYDNAVVLYSNAGPFKELLGVMTFGRHQRQGHENVAVLNRLCWKGGVSIIGGAKRLLHHGRKLYPPDKRVVTWSDNRWSIGGVYERMGFKLEIEYGPDYFYVNNKNEVASKQSKQKRHLNAGPNETEEVAAKRLGWNRVYDCGKKKWVLGGDQSTQPHQAPNETISA